MEDVMKIMNDLLIPAFVLLLFSGTALAHKVNLFAYAEAGKVYTESYFPDGRPVEGGKEKDCSALPYPRLII